MAMPEVTIKDDQLQRICWGSASVENYDTVHTPLNANNTSSYPGPLIPNGTFLGHEGSGYGDGEQTHKLKKAGSWPHGYLLPSMEFPAKDNYPYRIPLGVASPDSPNGLADVPGNGNTMFLNSSLTIPEDDDTFSGYNGRGYAPYSDVEQIHTAKEEMKPEGWPYEYSLPSSEFPAEDDYHHGTTLGVARPKCPDGLAYTPWNGNTISLNSSLPVPEDDDTFLGYQGPGSAPYSHGEQSHIFKGGLKVEGWPYPYHVPVGYPPACQSNRTHKRRRFTDGEKLIISYKRKVGVCRDCRHAKRKCTHGQLDMVNAATESGVGIASTRAQGSSDFDGSEK